MRREAKDVSGAPAGGAEWRREQWDLGPDSIALALESLVHERVRP